MSIPGLGDAVQLWEQSSAVLRFIKKVGSDGFDYRTERFGVVLGTIFRTCHLVDTDALQKSHWDINAWTDEEVLAWKVSHLESCNAIAVAAAIFASVGLTALQLPNMNSVHWTARACCAASMVLGVVSVTTATRQHQTVGVLNSPLQVRLWLSRGMPEPYRVQIGIKVRHSDANEPVDKYAEVDGFEGLPLESSVSAQKEIAFPRHLLTLAVFLFLVGFLLYELFLWLEDVENSGRVSRNTFIVFMLTVGTYAVHDFCLGFARIIDDEKRNNEFNTKSLGGFHKPEELYQLKDSLENVRERMKTWNPQQHRRNWRGRPMARGMEMRHAPPGGSMRGPPDPKFRAKFHYDEPTNKAPKPHFNHLEDYDYLFPHPAATGLDKYQAWQHYLTGYMGRQEKGAPSDQASMLKLMELKGSFDAEWDAALAVPVKPPPRNQNYEGMVGDEVEERHENASGGRENAHDDDQA